MFEQIISFDRMEQAVSLFGSFDENVKLIESKYSVNVISRGSDLKVTGEAENVARAVRAINGLMVLINKGEPLNEQNVRYVLSLVDEGDEDKLSGMINNCICITSKGRPVKPKTLGQEKYVEAIKNETIVFFFGYHFSAFRPAGEMMTCIGIGVIALLPLSRLFPLRVIYRVEFKPYTAAVAGIQFKRQFFFPLRCE